MEFIHPALFIISSAAVAYAALRVVCDGFNNLGYLLICSMKIDDEFDVDNIDPQSPLEYVYGLIGFIYLSASFLLNKPPFGS